MSMYFHLFHWGHREFIFSFHILHDRSAIYGIIEGAISRYQVPWYMHANLKYIEVMIVMNSIEKNDYW